MPATCLSALSQFIEASYSWVYASIETGQFHESQSELLRQRTAIWHNGAKKNPFSTPQLIFYAILKSRNYLPDARAEALMGTFMLYLLAADVWDDVQDQDLDNKPEIQAGDAIAINNGISFLFLALTLLRQNLEQETDAEKRLLYLEALNQSSLKAVRGQHLDLNLYQHAQTPEEVLKIQVEKSDTFPLIGRCAALLAGCNLAESEPYYQLIKAFVTIGQILDDIKDILVKPLSPDLKAGKNTYPIACFKQRATPQQRRLFQDLLKTLPDSLHSIRKLIYESGALQQCAETLEQSRLHMYQLVAHFPASPYLRLILQMADFKAAFLYPPPLEAKNLALLQVTDPWSDIIQEHLHQLREHLKTYSPPLLPSLIPWHQPHFMYEPGRQIIFYPDLRGLSEEILPVLAGLLNAEDETQAQLWLQQQTPFLLGHEFFHYWRDVSQNLSQDKWFEELVANSLMVNYLAEYLPDQLPPTLSVAQHLLAPYPEHIFATGQQILERLFVDNAIPKPSANYDVNQQETLVIHAAIIKQLAEKTRPFKQLFEDYLMPE